MKHAMIAAMIAVMAASCGGSSGSEQDTNTADTTPDTVVDTVVDTPVDSTPDTPVDSTPDTPVDSTPDTPVDTADDTSDDTADDLVSDMELDTLSDAAEDAEEDVVLDMLGDDVDDDTVTACELDGGYCTTYAIVADPCVTCASVGGTDYAPARSMAGAMGCTVGGTGAGAWCCLPLDSTSPPECQTSGGACYSGGGPSDPCPIGWVDDSGFACPGGRTCCTPGDSC